MGDAMVTDEETSGRMDEKLQKTMLAQLLKVIASAANVAGDGRMELGADKRNVRQRINELTDAAAPNRIEAQVANARFALGADDGAYLRSNVMPLQTSQVDCDEDRALGQAVSAEIKAATRRSVLETLRDDYTKRLQNHGAGFGNDFQAVAWLMSIQEIATFVATHLQMLRETGSQPGYVSYDEAGEAIKIAAQFEEGTAAPAAKSALEAKIKGVGGERILCLLIASILALFSRPRSTVEAQIEKTIGNEDDVDWKVNPKGMGQLQLALERLALTARHTESVFNADNIPTDYNPDDMLGRIRDAAVAVATNAMATGVVDLSATSLPAWCASPKEGTTTLDHLVRAASTGTSADELRRAVKVKGGWSFDKERANAAFQLRKAEKAEALQRAKEAEARSESSRQTIEETGRSATANSFDAKKAVGDLEVMRAKIAWQKLVVKANELYLGLLDFDEAAMDAVAAFSDELWSRITAIIAEEDKGEPFGPNAEYARAFKDFLKGDASTTSAIEATPPLDEKAQFLARWNYNISRLLPYDEDFQKISTGYILDRMRFIAGPAAAASSLGWWATFTGDAQYKYNQRQQQDLSILTRLQLFQEFFKAKDTGVRTGDDRVWPQDSWTALVKAVKGRNQKIIEAVEATDAVLDANTAFVNKRRDVEEGLREDVAKQQEDLKREAEERREFLRMRIRDNAPSFCTVAPFQAEDPSSIKLVNSSLCAAFTQLREGEGFSQANGPDDIHLRLKRVEGVSPFFNAPRERVDRIRTDQNDWWRRTVWNGKSTRQEFKELKDLPKHIDESYDMKKDLFNIREYQSANFAKRNSVAYALARGLCGTRTPYHEQQGEEVLLYSLPTLEWPGYEAFQKSTAKDRVLPSNTEEARLATVSFWSHNIEAATDFAEVATAPVKSTGKTEEVDPTRVALWAPVKSIKVPSDGYVEDSSDDDADQPSDDPMPVQKGAYYTFVADGNDERIFNLCDSVVLEHLVDYYKLEAKIARSTNRHLSQLLLGAAAYAKILQLPSLCGVMLKPDPRICAPYQQLQDQIRIFVTRPALRCPGDDVLYPCDAGLASYSLSQDATSEQHPADNTVQPPSEEEAYGRIVKDNNGVNVRERVNRSEATSYVRSFLSRRANTKDATVPDAKDTAKVPLYIAEAPGATGEAMVNILSEFDKRSPPLATTRAARKGAIPDVSNDSNNDVLQPLNIATRLREAVAHCDQQLAIGHALNAINEELEKEKARASSAKTFTNLDDAARERRQAVWNDAMREACISGDRLYAFARQFAGTISEQVDSVCLIDEGLLVRQQQNRQQARERLVDRAAQEQMQLVRSVFGAVIKESGLTLGIEKSGELNDLGQLKVVSNTLRKQASEIASGGASSEGYFSNSVRLENLLATGTGEMTLTTLFERLGDAGKAIQEAALSSQSADSLLGGGTSLDFLSAPRNSLLLRWKPESLAAVRQAFDLFQRELINLHGPTYRTISAYELMEGCDDALCSAFAQFCAHCLVHSRLYSSSTAMCTHTPTFNPLSPHPHDTATDTHSLSLQTWPRGQPRPTRRSSRCRCVG